MALCVYHFAYVSRRFRRADALLATHDGLLGAGAEAASSRIAKVEALAASLDGRAHRTDQRLAELERIAKVDVYRVGFVRYNAFEDVGSDLSYALALLNREGDGIVLSSIYSREDTRTYGKAVSAFSTVQEASKEELAAIARARTTA